VALDQVLGETLASSHISVASALEKRNTVFWVSKMFAHLARWKHGNHDFAPASAFSNEEEST
jgi:hypothetical protein